MINLSKALAIALPLTILCQSGIANAASSSLGTLPNGPSQFTETETGPFNDIYTFTLGQTSDVTFNYHDLQIGPPGAVNEIPDLMASLFTLGGGTLIAANIPENNATNVFWSGPAALAAGGYELHISGTPILAGLNHSTFDMRFEVSPVPEPETYGMMLAGLGLMGYVARRRKAGHSA